MDVNPGSGLMDGPAHRDVVVAIEAGVDPALQADFGRTPSLCLQYPRHDLGCLEQVGRSAEVQ
jgi:hypothetical protein